MFRIFIHAYALFVIYGLLHPSHTEGEETFAFICIQVCLCLVSICAPV